MEKINKFKSISLKKADAAADINLINQYAVKELTPEEVYCFSVILCDNEIDRDFDQFTNATIDALAPLFCGKTGISDHQWSADRQISRLYRVEPEKTTQKNTLGETLKVLRGSAYMLNNESNKSLIEAIEGGILKEVSIGVAMEKHVCSICGEELQGWWVQRCSNEHTKGKTYDGKLCYGKFEDPSDAYEFSFVAVPAVPGAGVTKCAGGAECKNAEQWEKTVDGAFELLIASDLSEHTEQVKLLMTQLQLALMDKAEREKREKIIADNQRFIEKYLKEEKEK